MDRSPFVCASSQKGARQDAEQRIVALFRHPSFFGLHFSLALVPDRDPLRHIALPLDRYRNRDRYRVSFHFDYDRDPDFDFDFDGASQKSVNYFRGTMKDAEI